MPYNNKYCDMPDPDLVEIKFVVRQSYSEIQCMRADLKFLTVGIGAVVFGVGIVGLLDAAYKYHQKHYR